MTHNDGWFPKCPDYGFEPRHDRGNRQTLDWRRIAIERFDLDIEPGVRWSEHAVALGLKTCDPLFPASGRHPETVNQNNGIRTFRWRGHGAPPCGVRSTNKAVITQSPSR